jgi:7,8-dihydropterin-6-yl-methyl-4-(beta-D-ribofuranosyl)aminobenzene 5'-phosphate synthase
MTSPRLPTTTIDRWRSMGIVVACTLAIAVTCAGGARQPAIEDEVDMPGPSDSLRITIVYDNHEFDPRLGTGWGFAAVVELRGHTVLFDTGADAPTLLGNMRALGIDPRSIDAVVLSHAHGDHTGGLQGLLETGIRPTVYLHTFFPAAFKQRLGRRVTVLQTAPGQSVAPGISTTGALDGAVPEQALIVETDRGLVVVTGCAHPGVERMVAAATSLIDRPVHLVMGGFHLRNSRPEEVRALIAEFRRLGVERVAPSHCTGDRPIATFGEAYGSSLIRSGVGFVIELAAVDLHR